MPTAKTTTPKPLDEARADHAALLAKAEAGQAVDPLALLQATADVSIAEARSHGDERRAQEALDAARKARIKELADSLASGDARARAARLLELHSAAVSALTVLHEEAVGYIEGLNVIDRELRNLGDLGDEIQLSHTPGTISARGVAHSLGHLLPSMLVADAASRPDYDELRLGYLATGAQQLHGYEIIEQLQGTAKP